jgi:hypothetical protein
MKKFQPALIIRELQTNMTHHEILSFVTSMEMDIIMLSEIRQAWKEKYEVI